MPWTYLKPTSRTMASQFLGRLNFDPVRRKSKSGSPKSVGRHVSPLLLRGSRERERKEYIKREGFPPTLMPVWYASVWRGREEAVSQLEPLPACRTAVDVREFRISDIERPTPASVHQILPQKGPNRYFYISTLPFLFVFLTGVLGRLYSHTSTRRELFTG